MNDYFREKNGMKFQQHIYLMGFMGSGKTYLGKELSSLLNIPFYDLDYEIETFHKNSIENIFQNEGEDFFRLLESEVLRSLSAQAPGIISLGGGTPCYHNNMGFINSNGISIYIDTSIELICSRLKHDKNNRPLIETFKNDPEQLISYVQQKILERKPYYQQAKIVVYQTVNNQANIITEILEKIKSI